MAVSAYAAVISVMHLMEHIQIYHKRQQIFLDTQLRQLESLREAVSFFQDCLEVYLHGDIKEAEGLVNRITDAAHAIEDTVDSYIVDDIHARYEEYKEKENVDGSKEEGKERSDLFSQSLRKIIEDMNSIKGDVVDIKDNMRLKDQPRNLASVASLKPRIIKKDVVAGLDDALYQIVDKLTRDQRNLQVIPITGMGGIGKTTLAKNAYDNRSIVKHFDIRGWITISQEYNVCDMLLSLLLDIKAPISEREKESKEYHLLGQKLHQHISSRRYLIMLDDMWDIEAWDKLNRFFPDNNNGSRIMITTRLSNVANNLGYSNRYEMKLLDDNESWSLLHKKLFVEKNCPLELEEVGKKIAKNCKGLPLSITVIGGLLAKSNMTREYWEHVADNISTTINSEDNDRCYKILSLSYNCLPIHLKPCFLYMGVYPEDHEVRVSELIKLWVAEGFLKPHMTKILEEVAEDYLKDLIDRNLIFVSVFGFTGNMKYCKIHDLLRDLCLKEAKKERFINVTNLHGPDTSLDMNTQRRIVVHAIKPLKQIPSHIFDALQSMPFIRSFTCNFELYPMSFNFRLLRVFNLVNSDRPEFIQVANARYINCFLQSSTFPSGLHLVWNLQTLIYEDELRKTKTPFNIWEMLQLRHLVTNGFSLTDPPCCQMDEIDDFVLKNLQTLSRIQNFKCTEEVLKRIPNVKKLEINYPNSARKEEFSFYCLKNIGRLHKLQSFSCWIYAYKSWPLQDFLQNINFPNSLKKLKLRNCNIDIEGITTKIGSLPCLQKLILGFCYIGEVWSPVEGQFMCLKYLKIEDCDNLVYWAAGSTHFPCLEYLILTNLRKLKEIPFGIEEIDTIRSIQLYYCNHSTVESANEILEYQQSLGNEDFNLVVEGIVEDEDEDEEE